MYNIVMVHFTIIAKIINYIAGLTAIQERLLK